MIVDDAVSRIKQNLRERLAAHKAPFHVIDRDAAARAIEALRSVDGEHWAAVWTAAAEPFEERGRAHETRGDAAAARDAYLAAYGLFHAGRFPSLTHPAKERCYRRSVDNYRAAGRFFDPPLDVVTVPFAGRDDEGDRVVFYVRRAAASEPRPVVVRWGGIDTWKEERHEYNEAVLAAGFAAITIDMPGVGESPVRGSLDAERQFLPLFDWIAAQPDLDAHRVLIVGMSYGGYWATKLAHLYPDRIAGAVNWGGGIDRFFSEEWNRRSAGASSYLMDLGAARARSVGASSFDEYIARVAGFSLRAQGVLDRPHAPMLIVNGRNDEQVPFDDMLLLLEHGEPKAARFFPGGHMGYGPDTFPTVLRWLRREAQHRLRTEGPSGT
jgi:pimeloyl-ACP methyl ester carboxylesterase